VGTGREIKKLNTFFGARRDRGGGLRPWVSDRARRARQALWADAQCRRRRGRPHRRGSTILAFAIVFWGARNGRAAETAKAILVAGFVTHGLDFLVMAHATWAGVVNTVGWSAIVISGVFALGFAYFAFGKR
jgi:hypothetical protein